jgi:hypothetical protein
MMTSILELLAMTAILADVSHHGNTERKLSTDERRAVRFLAGAHFSIERIASEIKATPKAVEDYCKSVFINAK